VVNHEHRRAGPASATTGNVVVTVGGDADQLERHEPGGTGAQRRRGDSALNT
jgi:hypothetical protein